MSSTWSWYAASPRCSRSPKRAWASGPSSTNTASSIAAAAMLDAVFVELGPLAHALFGDREQRGLAAYHDHVDDMVFLIELDPLHAGGRASHIAHVFLVEANAHAVPGRQDDVVLAVRDLDVDQLVALLDVDGTDADRARIAEFREHRLLDDAGFGREQQELI